MFKKKVEGNSQPDFKTYYSCSNQDYMLLVVGQIHRYMNKTENPEVDPHKYVHLIFDILEKTVQWRTDTLSTNDAEAMGQP